MSLRSRYYEAPAEEMELPPHPHMPRQDPDTGEWIHHKSVSEGEVHRQFLMYRELPQVRTSRERRESEWADWERRHPPRTVREWWFSSYASYEPKSTLSASGRPLRHAARATVPTHNTDPDDSGNATGGRSSRRRATLATVSQCSVGGRSSRRKSNLSNKTADEAKPDKAESDDDSDGDDEEGTLLTGQIPAEMLPPKEIFFRINEPRLLQIWIPSDASGGLGRLQAPFTVDFSSEDDIQRLNLWKEKALDRARVRFGVEAKEVKRSKGVPYTTAERGWVAARLRQEPDMSWPDIKNVFFPAFQGKYPRTTRTWDAFRTLVIKTNKGNREKNTGAAYEAIKSQEKETPSRSRTVVEESDFEEEEVELNSGEYGSRYGGKRGIRTVAGDVTDLAQSADGIHFGDDDVA